MCLLDCPLLGVCCFDALSFPSATYTYTHIPGHALANWAETVSISKQNNPFHVWNSYKYYLLSTMYHTNSVHIVNSFIKYELCIAGIADRGYKANLNIKCKSVTARWKFFEDKHPTCRFPRGGVPSAWRAHCNKYHDPIDLLEKFSLHCMLHQALQRLAIK